MQSATIEAISYNEELCVESDLPVRQCAESNEAFVCYLYH
jgi:hypothetical protein